MRHKVHPSLIILSALGACPLGACTSQTLSTPPMSHGVVETGHCGSPCSQAFILGTHTPPKAVTENCGPNCSQGILLGAKKQPINAAGLDH